MERAWISHRFLAAFMAASILAVGMPGVAAAAAVLSPHDPIAIYGEADLTAANGVVGGNGTIANPFVIEGWSINGFWGTAIRIMNTTSFLVIRNMEVYAKNSGYSQLGHGISLYNVSNVAVEDVALRDLGTAFSVVSSWNVAVFDFTSVDVFSQVVYAKSCWNLTVARGQVTGNSGAFVRVEDCHGVSIANNTEIPGSTAYPVNAAIQVQSSTGVVITNNSLPLRWNLGISADASPGTQISFNTIRETNAGAIKLSGSPRSNVLQNWVQCVGGSGVEVADSPDTTVADNRLESDYACDIDVTRSPGTALLRNAALRGNVSVVLEDSARTVVGGNAMSGVGIRLAGDRAVQFLGTEIRDDNTVDGYPVVVYRNCTGLAFSGAPLGQVFIDRCRDVRLANLTLDARGYRMFVYGTDRLSIEDNRLTGSAILNLDAFDVSNVTVRGNVIGARDSGFMFTRVRDLVLDANNLTGTRGGLSASEASGIRVTRNVLTNAYAGIGLHRCWDAVVEGNLLEGVGNGYLWWDWYYPDKAGSIELYSCSGVRVEANNITKGYRGLSAHGVTDGLIKGNEIQGYWGLDVSSGYNVSILSNRVTGWPTFGDRLNGPGIGAWGTGTLRIEDNKVEGPWSVDIWVGWAKGPVVRGNVVADAWENRIALRHVEGAVLEGNTVSGGSGAGILLDDSFGAVLRRNILLNDSIILDGPIRSNFTSHEIGPDNTVNGRPVLYFKECDSLVLEGVRAGQVLIADCGEVWLKNLSMAGGDVAVFVSRAASVFLTDARFADFAQEAVFVLESSQTTVLNGSFSGGGTGVVARETARLTVAGSTFDRVGTGVDILWSNSTLIEGNLFLRADRGIYSAYSNFLEVRGNVFSGNALGILVGDSKDVRVFHNDFERNEHHVAVGWAPTRLTAEWDAGYPAGGNYWWNFSSRDEYRGPNQVEEVAADGIWDTPYKDENLLDRYPLVRPFTTGAASHAAFDPPNFGNKSVTVIVFVPDESQTEYRYRLEGELAWRNVTLRAVGGGNFEGVIPPGEYERIVEAHLAAPGDPAVPKKPGAASGSEGNGDGSGRNGAPVDLPLGWALPMLAGGLLAGTMVFVLARLRPRKEQP